jgi:hypothetical protein
LSAGDSDFGLAVSTSNVICAVEEINSLEEALDDSTEDIRHRDKPQAIARNIDVCALNGDGNDKFATCWTSSLSLTKGEKDGNRGDKGERSKSG